RAGRDLRQRVRTGAAGRAGPPLAGRPERLPLDRDRHFRLHARRQDVGADSGLGPSPERIRRRARAVDHHAAARRARDHGGARARSEPPPRGQLRARRLQVADRPTRRPADVPRRDPHGDDARDRTRRGGDRAAPLHLCAGRLDGRLEPVALGRLDPADDLPVLRSAGSEPQRASLGARVRPDRVRARHEPDRAPAARTVPTKAYIEVAESSPVCHEPVTPREPTLRDPRVTLGAMNKKLTLTFASVVAVLAAVSVALVAAAAATASSKDTTITGAGSSFVSPLVSVWTPALGQAFGYTVQYSPVGSGAGIAATSSRQVDFGASDAPLTPDQATACKGCVQIPWALSATSIAYNVPGAPVHLNLSGPVIANIFLGQITNWNDAAIKKLNPGANLPALKITPIFRPDGSGTTFNFPAFLSAVSPTWKTKVGNSASVNFPTGIGARGSSGVAGLVSRTDGGITYVDVAFALKNHIKFAAVKNAAGKFL